MGTCGVTCPAARKDTCDVICTAADINICGVTCPAAEINTFVSDTPRNIFPVKKGLNTSMKMRLC
jgi:hypothetical protein